ncbi:hypothetical protein IAR55_006147 [Kwoniella newhampshirensis]|uniref:RNase III domain-containing protein n=1 Tax=Kwoniella newhampshirensis TaxID=1651941 RepID=A0AAW0YFS2_9TREE
MSDVSPKHTVRQPHIHSISLPQSRPSTPWIPPSPLSGRSRGLSETPKHVKNTTTVNRPFIRASSVRPPSSGPPSSPFGPQGPVITNEMFVPPKIEERLWLESSLGKIGRLSPTLQARLLTPVSQPHNRSNKGEGMSAPPAPDKSSDTILVKRKSEHDESETGIVSGTPVPSVIIKRKRLPSTTPDVKPNIPIPILPIPLPSKRFKKGATSRAILVPVEQLPVFALPTLPMIGDPDLVKQVFTHQSLFDKVKGRFEDPIDSPAKHYEKLEHVGDSILGMVVTSWLHETKPRLTIGTATKLKSHMVSNATLSHLSGLYNLPQRLNGDPNLLPLLRAQTDVRAALMEAYIAALYFSFPVEEHLTKGMKVIDSWLREMYEPLYDFFFNYMKKEHEQHHSTIGATVDGHAHMQSDAEIARIDQASIGMAPLVQMYTNSQDRELRYEEERYETNLGALWKIKCTVDGIELGEAVRTVKKTAKNVAAWEAAKKLGLTVSDATGVQRLPMLILRMRNETTL